MSSPKLNSTRDYSIFEMHEFNRPLHNDPRLLASMRKVGFMPSSPIHCVRNGNGKLKVVRGHNRLDCAMQLKEPVYYIIDDSKVDIFQLESGRQQWSASDFLSARASAGNAHCAQVIAFQKRHGLTLGQAASLLGGQSAGSQNHIAAIKEGTFKVAADQTHANAVVSLTDYCRQCGIEFATAAGFVAAISMCLRVPEFDPSVFKRRIQQHGLAMARRTTRLEYLDAIDQIYNHGAKGRRLALAFKAKEIARSRREHFGKSK